jgi:CRISPR-associated protein Cas5 subtype I-B
VNNLKVLKISIKGYTGSFRNPNSMKYQETLPFPPPTTIVGILGAASGYDFMKAQKTFSDLSFGIKVGKCFGQAVDLWAIRKFDRGRPTRKAIVKREMLVYPEFTVFVKAEEEILHEIQNALDHPVYTLSLGRDDELITSLYSKIIDAENVEQGKIENSVIQGKILPSDISADIDELTDSFNSFKVYKLVKAFKENKRTKARLPSDYIEYTYVDKKVLYKGNLIKVNGEEVPIWRWNA